jgi:hypothetical protein
LKKAALQLELKELLQVISKAHVQLHLTALVKQENHQEKGEVITHLNQNKVSR